MELELPYPPSINHYYFTDRRGRRLIKAPGKAYQKAVCWLVREAKADLKLPQRLHVTIKLWMPDRRKRDIDNVQKPILDALQKAEVYLDDCQIDVLHVERMGIDKPGKVLVNITQIEEEFN